MTEVSSRETSLPAMDHLIYVDSTVITELELLCLELLCRELRGGEYVSCRRISAHQSGHDGVSFRLHERKLGQKGYRLFLTADYFAILVTAILKFLAVVAWGTSCLEDVKNLICWGFRNFIFDPRCLPTPHRSLTGHPGEIFETPNLLQI
jgi:hypothetical protein